MGLIALCVRISSPGPAFFRQVRLGKDQCPFVMLKFRSMTADADDSVHRAYVSAMLTSGHAGTHAETTTGPENGALHKLIDDTRITRFGAFLRKTSLDELPQLINVFAGQMSMIGPRPSLPWEAALFGSEFRGRFDVRPGLTGLWQVSGRSQMTMRQALELDMQYVRDRSLSLDLTILLRTVPVVLSCRGAS
jgi:lipopolysaccharide/colanic/teichoic acid biosynthesis glycosyltransferase